MVRVRQGTDKVDMDMVKAGGGWGECCRWRFGVACCLVGLALDTLTGPLSDVLVDAGPNEA